MATELLELRIESVTVVNMGRARGEGGNCRRWQRIGVIDSLLVEGLGSIREVNGFTREICLPQLVTLTAEPEQIIQAFKYTF